MPDLIKAYAFLLHNNLVSYHRLVSCYGATYILGIIDRQEAIEAAKRKQKMSTLEKQYHVELKLELQGAQFPAVPNEVEDMDAEENAVSDVKQIADDVSNMSMVVMSRRSRRLLEAIEIGKERTRANVHRLRERRKKIDEASTSHKNEPI